jgi:hypothetical protein
VIDNENADGIEEKNSGMAIEALIGVLGFMGTSKHPMWMIQRSSVARSCWNFIAMAACASRLNSRRTA